MWIVCITSVRHVLTVNGYGGRQTKENEKSWCFKGWETLVNYITAHLQKLPSLPQGVKEIKEKLGEYASYDEIRFVFEVYKKHIPA